MRLSFPATLFPQALERSNKISKKETAQNSSIAGEHRSTLSGGRLWLFEALNEARLAAREAGVDDKASGQLPAFRAPGSYFIDWGTVDGNDSKLGSCFVCCFVGVSKIFFYRDRCWTIKKASISPDGIWSSGWRFSGWTRCVDFGGYSLGMAFWSWVFCSASNSKLVPWFTTSLRQSQ